MTLSLSLRGSCMSVQYLASRYLLGCCLLAGCGTSQPPAVQVAKEPADPAAISSRVLPLTEEDDVQAAAFSPDGRTLAAWIPGRVRLWDLASGQVLGTVDPGSVERG